MKEVPNKKILKQGKRSICVAIGNFDGLHLGHKEILKKLKTKAKKINGLASVYTFYPHPSKILYPRSFVPQINSLEERLILIKHKGIDVIIVEKFTRAFSRKTAEQFFREIIVKKLKTRVLYVGYNFFFGKDRQGDTELLQKLCAQKHIELHIIKPFKIKNEIISSSKIRTLILKGDIKKAKIFLGRYHFIQGIVMGGQKRGKILGIPTANLKTSAELIPKMGVYITLTEYQRILYPSVTSIGHVPTFSQTAFTIETHILNFNKDIYGQSLILHFVDRIRDIQKFDSPKDLVKQIHKDIQKTKKLFR